MNTTDISAMRPLLLPDDQQFWYETLRALGHTACGGADIGEVVTTAAPITAGDYDIWYEQWAATAQRTEARHAPSWPSATGSAPATGCWWPGTPGAWRPRRTTCPTHPGPATRARGFSRSMPRGSQTSGSR